MYRVYYIFHVPAYGVWLLRIWNKFGYQDFFFVCLPLFQHPLWPTESQSLFLTGYSDFQALSHTSFIHARGKACYLHVFTYKLMYDVILYYVMIVYFNTSNHRRKKEGCTQEYLYPTQRRKYTCTCKYAWSSYV